MSLQADKPLQALKGNEQCLSALLKFSHVEPEY